MNECLSVWRKTWSWIAFLFHATLGGALLVSVCIGSGFADMGKFWSVFVIGGLALAFLGTALWLYAPSVAGNYEMRRKKEDFWDIMTGFGILLLFAGPAYVAMYAEIKRAWADNNMAEIGLFVSCVVTIGAYILGLALSLNSTLRKWSEKSIVNCWAFFMGIIALQAPLIADMLSAFWDPQNTSDGTRMIMLVILNAFLLLILHTSTQYIAPSSILARQKLRT